MRYVQDSLYNQINVSEPHAGRSWCASELLSFMGDVWSKTPPLLSALSPLTAVFPKQSRNRRRLWNSGSRKFYPDTFVLLILVSVRCKGRCSRLRYHHLGHRHGVAVSYFYQLFLPIIMWGQSRWCHELCVSYQIYPSWISNPCGNRTLSEKQNVCSLFN